MPNFMWGREIAEALVPMIGWAGVMGFATLRPGSGVLVYGDDARERVIYWSDASDPTDWTPSEGGEHACEVSEAAANDGGGLGASS